jgi:hypothetical protein
MLKGIGGPTALQRKQDVDSPVNLTWLGRVVNTILE